MLKINTWHQFGIRIWLRYWRLSSLFIQNTLTLSEKLTVNSLAGQFGFISWLQSICEQLWFPPYFHWSKLLKICFSFFFSLNRIKLTKALRIASCQSQSINMKLKMFPLFLKKSNRQSTGYCYCLFLVRYT